MNQRKKILMTNLYFQKFTGSELHILEFARRFREKGYDVTIAVYKKAFPLLEEVEDGITVVECRTEELTETEYDVIFVQHYPVFDYLASRYRLKYKRMIVSRLSVINAMEQLPVCTDEAGMILCVSQECADLTERQLGSAGKIRVFKNCVEEEFFKVYKENAGREHHLEHIAVISNHIPDEILELKERLEAQEDQEGKNGGSAVCQVDLIGMDYQPRRVTADVLKDYDLVLTIGRTVQACFASGVPVYVYDYLGGPGYITKENLELAERNNFSGRGFGRKTAEELEREIVGQYEEALGRLSDWKELADREYQYTRRFDEMYEELISLPELEENTAYYEGNDALRMQFYSEIVSEIAVGKDSQRSQCYYHNGTGFEEKASVSWPSVSGYSIRQAWEYENVRSFRFDPCNAACLCEVYDLKINGVPSKRRMAPVNAVFSEGGQEIFLTDDPQYVIEIPENAASSGTLEIEFRYDILTEHEKYQIFMEKIGEVEGRFHTAERKLKEVRDRDRRKSALFGMKRKRKKSDIDVFTWL